MIANGSRVGIGIEGIHRDRDGQLTDAAELASPRRPRPTSERVGDEDLGALPESDDGQCPFSRSWVKPDHRVDRGGGDVRVD